MFCPNCGTNNGDSAKFCENCGTALIKLAEDTKAPASAPTSEPGSTAMWPEEPKYSGSSYNAAPAKEPHLPGSGLPSLHGLASSPLMLLAAIALTLVLILNFIGITFTDPYSNMVDTFVEFNIDVYAEALSFFEAASTPATRVLSAIFSSILPALYCLAVWLIYTNSKKQKNGTAGLTIIKVISIIAIVLAGIFGFFVLILSVILLAAGSAIAQYSGTAVSEFGEYGAYADSALEVGISVVAALFLVVGVIAVAFVIVYYAKLLSTVNAVKYTLMTGEPKLKGVSGFVGVCCCIFAGIYTLSVIATIIGAFGRVTFATLTDIPFYVAEAVSSVCFGILIFKYRGEMKGLMAK